MLDVRPDLHFAAEVAQPPIADLDQNQLRCRTPLSGLVRAAYSCQRRSGGALSFANFTSIPSNSNSAVDPNIRAIHLDPRTGSMPTVIGGISRWYLPYYSSTADPGPKCGVAVLARC